MTSVQVIATQPQDNATSADSISSEQIAEWEKRCEKCNRAFDDAFSQFDKTHQFDAAQIASLKADLEEDIKGLSKDLQNIKKEADKLESQELQPSEFTPMTNIAGVLIGCASTTIYGICNNHPKESYLVSATVINAVSCIIGVVGIVYERQKNKTIFENTRKILSLNQTKVSLLHLHEEALGILHVATFFSSLHNMLSHEAGSAERCLLHFNYISPPRQGEDTRYSRIVSLCIEHLPDNHPLKKNSSQSKLSQSELQKEASIRLSAHEPFGEQDGSPKFSASFDVIEVNSLLRSQYGMTRPITFLDPHQTSGSPS